MDQLAMQRSTVAPWNPHDRLRSFVGALVLHAHDWLEDRRYLEEHRRFIEELEDNGDLAGFLEALGATREELQAWSISPIASAELLARMMARLGVSREALVEDVLVREDLERACRCCASWKQCRRWLRDAPAGSDGHRAFCPNATLLERVRRTVLGEPAKATAART